VAPQESATPFEQEPGSRERPSLLSVLRRRALIVLLVPILAGGAAAALVYTDDRSYESTAKLLFRQTITPELNAVGVLPNSPDADNLANSNVEIVGSRAVAAETSRRLGPRGVDLSPQEIADDVAVSTKKDSDVVDVAATAGSAERAALVADTYARSAVEIARSQQRTSAARALRIAEEQLASLTPSQARYTQQRLRDHITRLRILVEGGSGSPQIIQGGFVPKARSGNPVRTILLAVLFGIVLGVGLALLREQADRRLHRAEEVSAAFDAPVLTTVPRTRALKRNRPFDQLPPEVAEAFRMLQMNLRYAHSEPVGSVLVTSARSREGKTTVAWNLASAAAASGLAVALVEADMRRPALAERYDLSPAPGLAEALERRMPVAEVLQPVALSVDPKGNGYSRLLNVLVAGDPPPDPWALMESSAMVRLLEALKHQNDLVVLDTPPIAHVADAISLLRRVDGVLVTASVSSTSGEAARQLRDQLQALDARILGVVANGGSAATGYAYASTAPGALAPRGGAERGPDTRTSPTT
jgi:tyrosine-protein kinase